MEKRLIPYDATLKIEGSRILVLAPHPDDEVFGCGGAIMRHMAAGDALRVIILSDGDYRAETGQQRAYGPLRREESCNAASILGYGQPHFWGLPDCGIEYGEALVQRIEGAIKAFGADLIYAPSIHEMHPDHRALGMAALEALRRHGANAKLAMYEVGVPILHPNLLLDISNLREKKQEAMACFTSQLREQPYDQHIGALNRFRTYTLASQVTAAEAYFLAQGDDLNNDILGLYESEYQRQHAMGLPMMPRDVPLVSVIIRSMDRPTLRDALGSVALQTYPNIEVLVVNAKGAEHKPLEAWCGRFPLHLVSEEGALGRARAANVGMQDARGTYLIFLDDDDLFLPEHVAKLTRALRDDTARAAYTGVSLLDKDDGTVLILDEAWSAARLRAANFLPIHAVLFERSLLDQGCCFSESLDCLEDWEFWLQVAQHTAFLHVPGVSAVYRIGLGTSVLSQDADGEKHLVNRVAIFEAWLPRFTSREWVQSIYWFEMARDHFRKLAFDRFDEIQRTGAKLLETEGQLSETKQQLDASQGQLLDSKRHIDRLEHAVQAGEERTDDLQHVIDSLLNSSSWKLAAPIRWLSRLLRGVRQLVAAGLRQRLHRVGKAIYWRLPRHWRDSMVHWSYRVAGPAFRGQGHYELWRRSIEYAGAVADKVSGAEAGMVNLSKASALESPPPGRIAIHAHIFYPDLMPEFSRALGNMPFPYDLFVSVPSDTISHVCKRAFATLPNLGLLTVSVVPNRGRDIAPMFCTFGSALRSYDFIAHIHGKKSLYNKGATEGWRDYLLTSLMGSRQQIGRIFSLFSDADGTGLVYPQNYSGAPYMANTWLANQPMARAWCHRLGIKNIPNGYFDYPAGSMFWARAEAIRPFFDAGICIEDFPEEAGQTDGTLAHCIERMLALTARATGHKVAILRDGSSPSWSPWRFDQYLGRSREHVESMLAAPDVRVVVFDIFDSLLVRPLLNPESIKTIVARNAASATGDAYLALRAQAESDARHRAGRDVGLTAIFDAFATLSGLPPDAVAQLRGLEEAAELASVSPRTDTIELLHHALASGKRVVLASDMYLPKPIVEAMLARHGIRGWHQLYLSSEIGLRKDSGELYHHIFSKEEVSPANVLVIGDNERSDFQIPSDLGTRFCHLLRPVELARALPRMGPLVEQALHENDLDAELALGLIVQDNFRPLFFPTFDPSAFIPPNPRAMGYSVLGPMVLSFVQWLSARAAEDGMERLYFLAREGQFLKMVYDQWLPHSPSAPVSDYLVLSRRAVTVPMIANIEDIHAIARSRYFPNQVESFVHERFGLELDAHAWEKLWRDGIWPKGKLVTVNKDAKIEHLKPLLQALAERIFSQAQSERPGLLAYLNQMEINLDKKCAVVDVGYSATIQSRLNGLLSRAVHGYYLATEQKAAQVSQRYGVIAQGCFAHHCVAEPTVSAIAAPTVSAILRESFTLEKMLSSDDAQIVRHLLGSDGQLISESRSLSNEELRTKSLRAGIRGGAMEYVQDAIAARTNLLSDFTVPTSLGQTLYAAFVAQPSASETAVLRDLVLDDHYCGRGLVR